MHSSALESARSRSRALVFWASLAIAGPLISQLDPHRLEGGTATLDTIWFLGGWIMGLLYCFLIYGAKRLVLCFVPKPHPAAPTDHRG